MTKGEQARNKVRLSAIADRPRILGSKRSSVLGFTHGRTSGRPLDDVSPSPISNLPDIMKAEKRRINVFEDVLSNNDAYQVVVATLGDLISTKRVTTGARSKQWLGQMSDVSL